MFMDSDHAGDTMSQSSQSGFVIFLNHGMINWLSKKKSTIETSVFGAEFSAMRHGIETLRGLLYKLHMMGVPVNGLSYVFGDNMSLLPMLEDPLTLRKKLSAICYHSLARPSLPSSQHRKS